MSDEVMSDEVTYLTLIRFIACSPPSIPPQGGKIYGLLQMIIFNPQKKSVNSFEKTDFQIGFDSAQPDIRLRSAGHSTTLRLTLYDF